MRSSGAGGWPGGVSPILLVPHGALLPSVPVSASSSDQMICEGQEGAKMQSGSLVATGRCRFVHCWNGV